MTALIFIILGAFISLAGLGMIAPQVQVHQIDVKSKAAWIFRSGVIALIIGQSLALLISVEPALVTVSLIMGIALLFAGLTIFTHERQQPGFALSPSLSLQVFASGLIVTVLALF